jgi:hypothetical protein
VHAFGGNIDWQISAIGTYCVGQHEHVEWEFAIHSDLLIIGLIRQKDAKYLMPSSPINVKWHSGWHFSLGQREPWRYWSVVDEYSDYLGQSMIDHREQIEKPRPGYQGLEADQLLMVLDENTLTLSSIGPHPWTFGKFVDVDRSQPLVISCFLKSNEVTITRFSVTYPVKELV